MTPQERYERVISELGERINHAHNKWSEHERELLALLSITERHRPTEIVNNLGRGHACEAHWKTGAWPCPDFLDCERAVGMEVDHEQR